jgi:hypothetical protein
MSRAPVSKHSKYDESEPLKCFRYCNRSIDFINSTFNRWYLKKKIVSFSISPYLIWPGSLFIHFLVEENFEIWAVTSFGNITGMEICFF